MTATIKKELKAKKEQVLVSFQNARSLNTYEGWQNFGALVTQWLNLASSHGDYKSMEETSFYREKAP